MDSIADTKIKYGYDKIWITSYDLMKPFYFNDHTYFGNIQEHQFVFECQ